MVDGEFARIATISDQYPNVVIVPEPFGHYEMVAFSLNPEIDLSSYRIGDNDYHIGYMHGWVNVTTFECTLVKNGVHLSTQSICSIKDNPKVVGAFFIGGFMVGSFGFAAAVWLA